MRMVTNNAVRTSRFATMKQDLNQILLQAEMLGIQPILRDEFYAVLPFPEPHDIIVIAGYQQEASDD